jgi:hypothetical protein
MVLTGSMVKAKKLGRGLMTDRTLTLLVLGLLLSITGDAAAQLHRHTTRPLTLPGIPGGNYVYRPRSPTTTSVSRIGVLVKPELQTANELIEKLREQSGGVVKPLSQPPAAKQGETQEIIDDPPPLLKLFSGDPLPFHIPGEFESVVPVRWFPHLGIHPSPSAHEPACDSTGGERIRSATDSRKHVAERPGEFQLFQLETARLQIDHCQISGVALQLFTNGDWVLSLRADQNRRDEINGFSPTMHIKRNQFFVRLRCLGQFAEAAGENSRDTGKPVLAVIQPNAFWGENGQPRYLREEGNQKEIAKHLELIDRVEVEFFYR